MALFSGLAVLLCATQSVRAGHILGAYFSASQLDTGKYIINLTIIRDCNGVALSHPSITYSSGTNTIQHQLNSNHLLEDKDITGIGEQCSTKSRCSGNYPYGFEEYRYQDTIDLTGFMTCEWEVAYEPSSVRNPTINFQDSGPFYNSMSFNKCLSNSTPYFTNHLPNLLGVNHRVSLPFEARDTADSGDSLSYSLVPALNGKGTNMVYTGNRTYYRPLNFLGYPNQALNYPAGFHLNPTNGLLRFQPTVVNQVGVIVVEVKEWRKINGTMTVISTIRHDNSYIVINMPNNTPPSMPTSSGSPSSALQAQASQVTHYLCYSDTFRLDIPTSDPDGDSTFITWNGGIADAVFFTSRDTGVSATGHFRWKPDVQDVSSQPYTFTVTYSDNVCPLPATKSITYRLFVRDSLPAPTVDVGNDITPTHYGDTVFLFPTIDQLYNRVVKWSTTGDGHFTDSFAVNSAYIPGQSDQLSCSFQLKLEVLKLGNCYSPGGNWSDSLNVFRQLSPLTLDSLRVDPSSKWINFGDTLHLETDQSPKTGQWFQWSTTGDGNFSDSMSRVPDYFPGSQDWSDCFWKIYLHSTETGCSTHLDSFEFSRRLLFKEAVADSAVLRGDTIYLSASMDSLASGNIRWITSGDGQFGDTLGLNTWYLPGPGDYQNCQSLIYAEDFPSNSCGVRDSAIVEKKVPVFTAGSDMFLVPGDTAVLNANPVENANWQFGYWTTSGDGHFIDSNASSAQYIPGPNDWSECGVQVFWNERDAACGGRKDSVTIGRYIKQGNAGQDQSAFYSSGLEFNLNGTNDTVFGLYSVWRTQGDGTFSDSLNPVAIYTPGAQDLQNCEVVLSYSEYPNATQCGYDDLINLTIEDSVAQIVGVHLDSSNFDTVYLAYTGTSPRGNSAWSSTGSGSFIDMGTGAQAYVLSASDKALTDIELTITHTAPCKNSSASVHVDPSQLKTGLSTLKLTGLRVYPNPANDILNVETGGEIQSIQVIDIRGRVLVQSSVKALDIAHLASGSYMLRVELKDGSVGVLRWQKQ